MSSNKLAAKGVKRKKTSTDASIQDSKPAQKQLDEDKPQTINKRTRQADGSSPVASSSSAKKDAAQYIESLEVIEKTSDLFSAPTNTVLIHACNCKGSWSAGIAKAFHDRYPHAYKKHKALCDDQKEGLIGTAQLISPVDYDVDSTKPRHFVGCLFTSRKYGKAKDSKAEILSATASAMEDLLDQVNALNMDVEDGQKIEEVWMCKINAGLFRVPWSETRKLLEGITIKHSDKGSIRVITVVSPDSKG